MLKFYCNDAFPYFRNWLVSTANSVEGVMLDHFYKNLVKCDEEESGDDTYYFAIDDGRAKRYFRFEHSWEVLFGENKIENEFYFEEIDEKEAKAIITDRDWIIL